MDKAASIFTILLSTLLGAVVGSFVNVVASRVPEGLSLIRPRSRCPNCLSPIAPYDNVPVLSYVLLRGRCRYCGWRIPARYPITELCSSLGYLTIFWKLWLGERRLPMAVLAAVAFPVLLSVAVVDLETRRIPRPIVFAGLAFCVPVGIASAIFEGRGAAVWVGLAGALALWLSLFLIHELNPTWMGFGDVRYALFLGWTLGIFGARNILVALMIAVASGSLVGMSMIALGKGRFGQALPFGPFLSLGAFVSMIWGSEIAAWYLRLIGLGAFS